MRRLIAALGPRIKRIPDGETGRRVRFLDRFFHDETVRALFARTVDALEERKPEDAIFIVGGDEFVDFPAWKEPAMGRLLVRMLQSRVALPEVQGAGATAVLVGPWDVALDREVDLERPRAVAVAAQSATYPVGERVADDL